VTIYKPLGLLFGGVFIGTPQFMPVQYVAIFAYGIDAVILQAHFGGSSPGERSQSCM
jgi:hypothetical protein